MNRNYLLKIALNAVYIYVCVLATWIIVASLRGEPIDGEGGALLQAMYAPIVSVLTLTIIYALSILDGSVLKPAFVGLATIAAELATLAGSGRGQIISEEYIFFAHLLALVVVFAAWTGLRKAGYIAQVQEKR